jgi:hypothetical protein
MSVGGAADRHGAIGSGERGSSPTLAASSLMRPALGRVSETLLALISDSDTVHRHCSSTPFLSLELRNGERFPSK